MFFRSRFYPRNRTKSLGGDETANDDNDDLFEVPDDSCLYTNPGRKVCPHPGIPLEEKNKQNQCPDSDEL